MRQGTQSLERALTLLEAIVGDDGGTPASGVAAELGITPSTARRLVSAMKRRGFLVTIGHGRYAAGPRLTALAGAVAPHRDLLEAARPVLRRLAREEGWAAHLGTLDADMVTYLVKEGGDNLFTREGAQLEAYCTGIGKALLAAAPRTARGVSHRPICSHDRHDDL